MQPSAGLQPSFVQAFPSSHDGGAPPWQLPPLHVSFVVHRLPSLQGRALWLYVQPVAGLQLSVVQTLPSSQSGGLEPTHCPPAHWSCVVHRLPSLHIAVLFVWVHPVAGSQPSFVHGLPSSQSSAPPGWQEPPWHWSLVVHTLASLQGWLLSALMQPWAGSQVSVVQKLPSSHVAGVPGWHAPPWHTSPVVHTSPSLQSAVFGGFEHPVTGSHRSSVHGLLSEQLGPLPPVHVPLAHTSPVVQLLPSSQGPEFGVYTHPSVLWHVSVVQMLPSSQTSGGPPSHTPFSQVSFVVQALPSPQGSELGVKTHPVAGLQDASVQTLPSAHRIGAPAHAPATHVSAPVHALPSLQTPPEIGVFVHPVAGSQPSAVQASPSSHSIVIPGAQPPFWQTSLNVHALPSLQVWLFGVY